jgi:hypothetical protein
MHTVRTVRYAAFGIVTSRYASFYASFVPHRDSIGHAQWLRHFIRGSFYVLPVAADIVITNAWTSVSVPHVDVTRVNVKNVNKQQSSHSLPDHCAHKTPAGAMVLKHMRRQGVGAMLVCHRDGKIASQAAYTRRLVHNEFNGALRGSRVDQVARK